jgi:hypothetical protein
VAVLRAATAPVPPTAGRATDAERQKIFAALAVEEAKLHRDAAKDFPTDAWSADDDLHLFEAQRARAYAASHHFRFGDVLGALDDGMRLGWSPPFALGDPHVPPCRPRAIY